jgi:hAT family C-terminal dimerisation region
MVGGECFDSSVISYQLTCIIWQVNFMRYHPAWASLARDYLSVMSSSVSSERAFSQGGITISKRRNRLKGDLVEALQCVKCAIQHDLLFQAPAPSSILEAEVSEDGEDDEDGDNDGETAERGWDNLLIDDDDDKLLGMDTDIDSD